MDSSTLLSGIALVVSIATLFHTYQTDEVSIAPYLNWEPSEFTKKVTVDLKNVGNGVAIITFFDVEGYYYIDGKRYDVSDLKEKKLKNGELLSDLYSCIPDKITFTYKNEGEKTITINKNGLKNYEYRFVEDQNGIGAGQSLCLLKFESDEPDQIHAVRAALKDLKVTITYTDIKGENEVTIVRTFDGVYGKFFEK